MADPVRPVEMAPEGTSLRVRWNDGHESFYPPARLRLLCTCAHCVDEITGVRRIAPGDIPPGIHPLLAEPVGRYGLRITWSDNHSGGIYTYDYLRSICPCPACAVKWERPSGRDSGTSGPEGPSHANS
jgi:DUF971 family protein